MMDSDKADGDDSLAADSEFVFHYIKSSNFRVIPVDGAWGGVSQKGSVHVGVYNERRPIPKETARPVLSIEDGGNTVALGPDEVKETIGGYVREVEALLVLDYDTAVNIHKWLGEKIESIQQMSKILAEENENK